MWIFLALIIFSWKRSTLGQREKTITLKLFKIQIFVVFFGSKTIFFLQQLLFPLICLFHSPPWLFGQISIKYFKIWIGSEMLLATGWPWLKSSMRTGAKQIDKFWGFILFRPDWAVTRDRWSMMASKQFWNKLESYLLYKQTQFSAINFIFSKSFFSKSILLTVIFQKLFRWQVGWLAFFKWPQKRMKDQRLMVKV